MRTFSTFLVILFFTYSAQAQMFPSEEWHQGKVVLTSDDTLQGLIKYNFDNDAIQVKLSEEKVEVYTAHNIFYFEIFDEGIQSFRNFYSLPYQVSADYSIPILFEVLYEGRLTLLSREKIVQETNYHNTHNRHGSMNRYGTMGMNNMPHDTRLMLDFDFYFLEKDGSINLYEPKKRRLLSIMDRNYNEVKKYMQRNRLRHDHISDLVRITAYYNALGE